MEAILFFHKIRQQYKHTDHRRKSSRKSGSEDPHTKRKNEQVIQNNIGETACYHGGHGKRWSTIISDKTLKDMVEHECRGKHHQHFQIQIGDLKYLTVGSENLDQVMRGENPRTKE